MDQKPTYSIQPLSDCALLIGFGNEISRETRQNVLNAYEALRSSGKKFINDLVPAYSSLAVMYDLEAAIGLPGKGSIYEKVVESVTAVLTQTVNREPQQTRNVRIPVCYAAIFAPDLEMVAAANRLKPDDVIDIHCSVTYDVFMLGFLPGFAYMGIVDARISTNRKETPRTLVPRGSVALAGLQTGIYPLDSPGGWQIIGRTPVTLFDPGKELPSFFLPGDRVNFYPISQDEFENY